MVHFLRTPAAVPLPTAQQLLDFLSLLTEDNFKIAAIWEKRLTELRVDPHDPKILESVLSGLTPRATLLRENVARCTTATDAEHTTHKSSVTNDLFLKWKLTAKKKTRIELDENQNAILDHAVRSAQGPHYCHRYLQYTRVIKEADVNDRLYLTWLKPVRDLVNIDIECRKLEIGDNRPGPVVNIRAQRYEKAKKPAPKEKEDMRMFVDHVFYHGEASKKTVLLVMEEKVTRSVNFDELANFHEPQPIPAGWEPKTLGEFDNNMQRHLTQTTKYVYSHDSDCAILADGGGEAAMDWGINATAKKLNTDYWEMQTEERTAMISLVHLVLRQLGIMTGNPKLEFKKVI